MSITIALKTSSLNDRKVQLASQLQVPGPEQPFGGSLYRLKTERDMFLTSKPRNLMGNRI